MWSWFCLNNQDISFQVHEECIANGFENASFGSRRIGTWPDRIWRWYCVEKGVYQCEFDSQAIQWYETVQLYWLWSVLYRFVKKRLYTDSQLVSFRIHNSFEMTIRIWVGRVFVGGLMSSISVGVFANMELWWEGDEWSMDENVEWFGLLDRVRRSTSGVDCFDGVRVLYLPSSCLQQWYWGLSIVCRVYLLSIRSMMFQWSYQ